MMGGKEENPKRKDLRLKKYNYSTNGAYFITVCTKDRKNILSHIAVVVGVGALDDPKRGAHDDPKKGALDDPKKDKHKQNFAGNVQIKLTRVGKIIEKKSFVK